MPLSRTILTAGLLCATAAGCDKAPQSPPAPRPAAQAKVPLPELPADATTLKIPETFRAAGVPIPDLLAVAKLPWGQLAGFRIDARKAAAEWARLRAAVDRTDYYPLIAINNHDWLLDIAEIGTGTPLPDILNHAAALDHDAWFAKQDQGRTAYEPNPIPRGPWKDADPHTELLTLKDHEGNWEPDVLILLLPTREGWQTPAYLGWGNWNSCPEASVHTAIFKRWQQQYGAEPMLIAQDVIEARVARPPQTRDAALSLAREHYLYCADIVDQGVGTLDALAAGLKDAGYWYFWWD